LRMRAANGGSGRSRSEQDSIKNLVCNMAY
jgi:hypothetical protein